MPPQMPSRMCWWANEFWLPSVMARLCHNSALARAVATHGQTGFTGANLEAKLPHIDLQPPRERLLDLGAQQLSAVELLAVLLGTGAPGMGVLELARELLSRFGSLDSLLHQSSADLLAIDGLGWAKVARLKAAQELSLRVAEEQLQAGVAFQDPGSVARYIQKRLGHRSREVFGCLFLDTRHRLLAWEELFLGSIDRAHVHAREIVRRALMLNAAAVIFGHNHPSGVAEPSAADLRLTEDLGKLLQQLDLRLLDHIVVSRSSSVSLAQRGLMTAG